jgi:carbonyl reductase 1
MTTDSKWWSKDTVAVVTGGNRGIGYETARIFAEKGLTVVLTTRDSAKGQEAADALKAAGHESIWFYPLDVSNTESAEKLAAWLKSQFGGIDILINNAAVLRGRAGNAVTYENAKDIVETNYYGTKTVTKALLPLLRASDAGARIVNVTSRGGLYNRLASESLKKSFKDEDNYSEELVDSLVTKYLEDAKVGRTAEEGWVPNAGGKVPMYSESKMFLNVYSVQLAKYLSENQPEDHKIFVTSYCPGPTETVMFTEASENGFVTPDGVAVKTAADGADTGIWLALLPKEELQEKNGKFFGERTEYPFGLDPVPF